MRRLLEYFGLSKPASPARPTLFEVKRAAVEIRRYGTSMMQLGIIAAIPAAVMLLRLLSQLLTRRFGAASVGPGTIAGMVCLVLACCGIPLGIGLRRYREWAREVLLEVTWLVVAAAAAAPFVVLFLGWTQEELDAGAWAFIGCAGLLAVLLMLIFLRRVARLKSPVVLAVFAPDTPAAEETLSTLGKDEAAERAARWGALSKSMRDFAGKVIVFGVALAIVPPLVFRLGYLEGHTFREAAREWFSTVPFGWTCAAIAAHIAGWALLVSGAGFLGARPFWRRMLVLTLRSILAVGAAIWLAWVIFTLASRPSPEDFSLFLFLLCPLAVVAIPALVALHFLRSPDALAWCAGPEASGVATKGAGHD